MDNSFKEVIKDYELMIKRATFSVYTYIDRGDGTFIVSQEYKSSELEDFKERLYELKDKEVMLLSFRDIPLFIYWTINGRILEEMRTSVKDSLENFVESIDDPFKRVALIRFIKQIAQIESEKSLENDKKLSIEIEDWLLEKLKVGKKTHAKYAIANIREYIEFLKQPVHKRIYTKLTNQIFVMDNKFSSYPKLTKSEINYLTTLLNKIEDKLTNEAFSINGAISLEEFVLLLRTPDYLQTSKAVGWQHTSAIGQTLSMYFFDEKYNYDSLFKSWVRKLVGVDECNPRISAAMESKVDSKDRDRLVESYLVLLSAQKSYDQKSYEVHAEIDKRYSSDDYNSKQMYMNISDRMMIVENELLEQAKSKVTEIINILTNKYFPEVIIGSKQ